jgi:hypothetical protein
MQKEAWKRKKNIYLKCNDTSPTSRNQGTVCNGSAIIRAKERLRRTSKMIGNGKKPQQQYLLIPQEERRLNDPSFAPAIFHL